MNFKSIRMHITFIATGFLLAFFVILSGITISLYLHNLQLEKLQNSNNRLIYISSDIDANLGAVTQLMERYQKSQYLLAFVQASQDRLSSSKLRALDYLNDSYAISSSSHIHRIVVGRMDKEDVVQLIPSQYSSSSLQAGDILRLPYYDQIYRSHNDFLCGFVDSPLYTWNGSLQSLPVGRYLYNSYASDIQGFLYLELSGRVILDAVYKPRIHEEHDSLYYLTIGENTWLCGQDRLEPMDGSFMDAPDVQQRYPKSGFFFQYLETGGRRTLCLSRNLDTPGISVSTPVTLRPTPADFRGFAIILVLIILMIGLLGLVMIRLFHRTIDVPIERLKNRLLLLSQGDFSEDSSIEWEHELGEIGRSINEVSKRLELLMDYRISAEHKKNEYEYRMLQSQINPHFLYNTLTTIKWMAAAQGVPGIADMVTSLSRLLKNIAKGTSYEVTIEEELALLSDYIEVQKYHYGGIITCRTDVEDPALLQCRILRFTLQPVVENAIFHGIVPKKAPGTINIRIFRTDECDVAITVTDDGVGIEESLLSQLLEQEQPGDKTCFNKIGIYNVHHRLLYEYGPAYGLSVESQPGVYTTVTVRIPAVRKET